MKRRIRSTVCLSLLCCATLAACGESVDPQSSTRTITATATPTSVTRSERTWVDPSRATAHNGNYAGAPDRTLRTLIWQPATAGPLPLFVMAHGFGGLPEKFEVMARTIAAAGFVVAAPAFPLTNENAPGGHTHGLQDIAHQPGDVSFVIDQLLLANAAPGDALQNRILPDEIAVLGHSLGGTTVAALTRKNCCRDNRVRASILFAAGPLDLFTNLFGTDPITAGPPTLILHGTVDSTVTFATSQRLYSDIDPPRFFVGITGADHSDAIEAPTEPLTSVQLVSERAIVAFLNAMFRGANTELGNTLAALAAEGNPVESDGTLQ
jgi:predicted dienelactone hydrolase